MPSNKLAPLQDMTILMAEDDPGTRESLVRALRLYCANVIAVSDGLEAVSAFQNKRVDIILLDIMMPNMDGLEAAAKIREFDQDIPIIILTAYDDRENMRAAVRLRLMDYLVKPVDLQLLKATLQDCLHELEKRGRVRVQLKNGTIFNSITSTAEYQGTAYPLTRSEKLFLDCLLRHRGQVVNSEEINSFVSRNADLTPGGLRTLVYRLRAKVGSDAIISVKDLGYMVN